MLIRMENNNQIVFTPHWGQYKILTSEKRFLFAIAGIQGGKTTCGVFWSQLQMQKYPTENGLICGLSHDQVSNVILDKFFTIFPQYRQFFIKKEKTLYLPTGGKVFFRPLEDPKYIEGITAKWVWIDEGDLISYKAYLIVRGRIGATGGRLLITSSLADGGWLDEYSEKMGGDQEVEVVRWRSIDNPGFSRAEWEALKAELDPTIFRRRYEAIGTKASGRVYSNFDFSKHVKEFDKDEFEEKAFLGFDWGWADPCAIVCVSFTNKKNLYVTEDFALEKISFDLIEQVVNKFRTKHKIVGMYGDPENKMVMNEISKKIRFEIQSANRDLTGGIEKVRNLIFQNRLYVLPKCTNILREIRLYRYEEKLNGISEEPKDENNHCLDALRYIVATYPFPSVKKVEKVAPELPPFWLRRTALYKRELDKLKNESYTDDDIWY